MSRFAGRLAGAVFGLASIACLGAGPAHAAKLVYQISDINMSGLFFSVSGGGTFDNKGSSNVAITETGPGFSYNYSLTGPVDGAGWNNIPSQHPPTLCILLGCNPIGAPIPGTPLPFNFSINGFPWPTSPGQSTTVAGGGEDDIEIYSGTAKITLTPVPEPALWAMLMLGVGAVGAAARSGRRKLAEV